MLSNDDVHAQFYVLSISVCVSVDCIFAVFANSISDEQLAEIFHLN